MYSKSHTELIRDFTKTPTKQFPFLSPQKLHSKFHKNSSQQSITLSPTKTVLPTPKNTPVRSLSNTTGSQTIKTIETEEEQIVKRLGLWEQENLNFKKENYELLYQSLMKVYTKEKNLKKIDEIESIEKIMKSTEGINQIYEKGAMVRGGALEKVYLQKKQEQKTLLLNTIAKTSARFRTSIFKNKIDSNLTKMFTIPTEKEKNNLIKKEEGNQMVYRKVINENNRKENLMRNDLMEISKKIIAKKNEKSELLKQLNNLYHRKQASDEEYNKKKNKLKIDVLNLQDHFDNAKRKLSKKGASKDDLFSNILKNASHGNSIEQKLHLLKIDNDALNKSFDQSRAILVRDLKVITEEEDYLKYIYHSMLKEHREYYYKILKNGYDVRYDGLVWVVRHLLEMNSILDYHHFPSFLDHDQINYLISFAQLFLDENIMLITLKSLKARQQRIRMEENHKRYNKLTDYCSSKKKETKFYITNKNNKKSIENRLLLTFSNLHNKYQDAFKNITDKKIDDNNLTKIINEIKTSLLQTGSYQNIERQNCLIKFFEENANNKDELEMILILRDKIKEIKQQREKMKKAMFEKLEEKAKNKNRYTNPQQSLEYELAFSALFGCNFSM